MKIQWSPTAIEQVVLVYSYWNERNKSKKYSNKLEQERILAEKRIRKNPYSFTRTNKENVRIYLIEHFKLFYEIRPNEVIVLAFFDSRQNPEKVEGII